ncbi:MAG: succinyl-diaminopimelate desuccinylase [Alphaproteobacteria bacterium]
MDFSDPLPLAEALIRRPSVTPADAGALDVLEDVLREMGFVCQRLPFSSPGTDSVENLYARLGTTGPNFCFAGHTDVVPAGQGWTVDPFGGAVVGGNLFGRGAADMKGAIAAFVAAVARILERRGSLPGSVSLLITGDEEGPGVNGTVRVLEWLTANGETLDACVVGEPTNPLHLGDMMKIGRRGSLYGRLTVHGTQGHTAYPELADNPIPRLLRMLTALDSEALDAGNDHFPPSSLALTSVDVGNTVGNVTPAEASATFNIRFNDQHTAATVESWVRGILDRFGGYYTLEITVMGQSFLTAPGPLSQMVVQAIRDVTGRDPALSTSGGTSDARFIKDACPVVEFGLTGQTMHKADEHIALADLESLTEIYRRVLEGFFSLK